MAVMTGIMEESLLALVLYDAENGKQVLNMIPPKAWNGIYKNVALKAVDYWDRIKAPPNEHVLDFIEDLKLGDQSRAELYDQLFFSLQETRRTINPKYVISKAAEFTREQKLRQGIIDGMELLEQGKFSDAESTVRKSLDASVDLFNPGVLFHEVQVSDLLSEKVNALPTGIDMLDERSLGPAAGELHLFIAPPNSGKSWYLIHLAKRAVAARKHAVYVSLEMSESRVAQRFIQSFCAVSKRRDGDVETAYFKENEVGQLIDIELQSRKPTTFEDKGIEKTLMSQLQNFRRRCPLVIKQFPTGMLTVRELRAYLDSLEAQQKIIPDLLCVDYADLMSLGTRDYRLELSTLYKDLRGLAVERNIAVATASQTNRDYSGKKLITGRGVAEDYSKIATCDNILTYNQTEAEARMGLARIYVDKSRNEEGKFSVLIAQNYQTGQFCVRSRRMVSKQYWKIVDPESVKKKK